VKTDQHVAVSLNGRPLTPIESGSDKWDGLSPHTVKYELDQSIEKLLVDGENTIVVQGVEIQAPM